MDYIWKEEDHLSKQATSYVGQWDGEEDSEKDEGKWGNVVSALGYKEPAHNVMTPDIAEYGHFSDFEKKKKTDSLGSTYGWFLKFHISAIN